MHELEIDFEGDKLNAMRPIRDFAKVNPGVAIPVLEDGAHVLFDSKVITQYLLRTSMAATQNSDIEPRFLRLWVREESEWEDLKVLSALETLTETLATMLHVRKGFADVGHDGKSVAYLERHEQRVETLFDWIDKRVTSNGFVPGHFSVMDIQLISALDFAIAAGVHDWRGRKTLEAARAEFSQRQSVLETAPVF